MVLRKSIENDAQRTNEMLRGLNTRLYWMIAALLKSRFISNQDRPAPVDYDISSLKATYAHTRSTTFPTIFANLFYLLISRGGDPCANNNSNST